MLRIRTYKDVLLAVALVLVGMLISWALLSTGASGLFEIAPLKSVQAESSYPATSMGHDALDPGAPSAWHTCTSSGVAVFKNRIHVSCATAAPGGIRFFALSTASAPHAARILSVLSMGHVTGKQLSIQYDPNDTSGEAAIGCMASDCRLIISASILP